MLRRALSSVLPRINPSPLHALPQALNNTGSHQCAPALSQSTSLDSSRWTSLIVEEFRSNEARAAASVAALPEEVRLKVLRAITKDMAAPGSVKYLSTLLRHADRNADGVLQLCVSALMMTDETPSRPTSSIVEELGVALKAHDQASQGQNGGASQPASPSKDLTTEQLMRVFTASAIPFVGFGFLDNLIMILAGDYIDASLGTALCLSTMAAAGLGNLISDIAGIFCADSIESRARVFKFGRMPTFTTAQAQSAEVSYAKSFGAVVGISIGCILGMFPLLFYTHGHAEPVHEPAVGAACDSEAAPASVGPAAAV